MLIGIDASRANKKFKTGPEWYSYQLIKQFARMDSENEYILYTNEPLSQDLLDLCKGSSRSPDNGKISRNSDQKIICPHSNFSVKILKWPYKFFWTQGRLSLEMVFSSPDLLFVPAHAIPYICPKSTVNTIHDIGFEVDRKFYNAEILGPSSPKARRLFDLAIRFSTYGKYGANSKDYLSWSAQYSVKHSKAVIVPSEFTKTELIRQYGAKAEKIKVIRNGYDADLFKPVKDESKISEVLANYNISKPYLLCVGKLETKKNTHKLVQAFGIYKQRNKASDLKLVLIGSASFGYDEVTYMMHEYGLERDMHMPGWLPQEEMPYIYSGAEAFIYPSLYEGFGIPLLEAMASGIPVAASNKTSVPEVTGDAALIFEPTSVTAMADAIEEIIENGALRKTLSAKGVERSSQFSWEKCAKDTLSLFSSL